MSKIGIIGGSGLYEIDGISVVKQEKVSTPYGDPSAELTMAKYGDKELVFLPRHGKGHTILPTELNYRANIYAMKKLGVDRIISLSACGSFQEELRPRDIVVVTQFVDRTNQGRKTTFFGEGIVAHISFGEPVCAELSEIIFQTAQEADMPVHKGRTYLNMEGPAFSTKAESYLYKSWGMDVIGMTNMPEARLAREAEICYSTVAFITDFDAWHEGEGIVTIDMIVENLKKNVDNAKKLLKLVLPKISKDRKCECKDALKHAIMTDLSRRPKETKEKLKLIIGKYVK